MTSCQDNLQLAGLLFKDKSIAPVIQLEDDQANKFTADFVANFESLEDGIEKEIIEEEEKAEQCQENVSIQKNISRVNMDESL